MQSNEKDKPIDAPPPALAEQVPSIVDVRSPVVDVRSLVGAGREAVILHKGDRYRLRITANDKLILTK